MSHGCKGDIITCHTSSQLRTVQQNEHSKAHYNGSTQYDDKNINTCHMAARATLSHVTLLTVQQYDYSDTYYDGHTQPPS